MTRNAISKAAQHMARQGRALRFQRTSSVVGGSRLLQLTRPTYSLSPRILFTYAQRSFSSTRPILKGLSPESEDPKPKEAQKQDFTKTPAELTAQEYDELSDEYMHNLLERFEELQESRDDVDVEYSVGKLREPMVYS